MIGKLLVRGFAVYGFVTAADKLATAYLEKNGKRIAEKAARKFIEYIFDEQKVNDHSGRPIYFENWYDAMISRSELKKILKEFGHVSLADYYETVGVSPRNEDEYFGWTDLDGMRILKERDNTYTLVMPKMKKLK